MPTSVVPRRPHQVPSDARPDGLDCRPAEPHQHRSNLMDCDRVDGEQIAMAITLTSEMERFREGSCDVGGNRARDCTLNRAMGRVRTATSVALCRETGTAVLSLSLGSTIFFFPRVFFFFYYLD